MKFILASTISLLAIGVMSCSQPDVVVSPNPYSGAKGGSGGGGSTTPPTSTTTPAPTSLPVLAPNPSLVYDLNPIMTTGTWVVKTYYRSFTDNTSDYSGYTFVFLPNGTMKATDSKGVETYASWRNTIGGQVLYYGGVSVTSVAMIFSKSSVKQLFRLNANWNVNPATSTESVIIDNFEPTAGERVEFVRQ